MKINFSVISEGLVESYADRDAFVNFETGRRYSFAEHHQLTNRIANMLKDALNLRVGDRYACFLQNDNLSLLHWVTAAKGEATCCHGNYRDGLLTQLQQIDTVKAKVVFLENDLLASHYAPLMERGVTIVAMDKPSEDYPSVLDFWTLVNEASPENTDFVFDDRDHVVLMRFTGGTTGDSSCVRYCFDNLRMSQDSYLTLPDGEFSDGCRMLHLAPLSHASGMLVFPTLFRGGCSVTMNEPDLSSWCEAVEQERITHAFLVPTLAYRLLDLPEAAEFDLSSLKTVLYGAAPMSPAKSARLIKRFGPIFLQLYGASEHFCVTLALSKKDHIVGEGEEARLAAAGRRTPNVEVFIGDDDGKPVKRGERGELYLRSRAICKGYEGNPEKTATEFVDGYWKSGDVGFADEHGYIHIVDRRKDMIITGGFNVYATEVENAINMHPDVFMSAVVGVPHPEWGEAVHAEVVLKQNARVTEGELIAHVKSAIGSMRAPKSVSFVKELPVSTVGKVLRKDVRAKFWASAERNVG